MQQKETTPVLTSRQMQQYERTAMQIRERAGVDSLAPLDPFIFAEAVGIVIKYDYDFDSKDWSGGGIVVNGQLHVLLNGNSTKERLNATLLEEIAHHTCRHKPTLIGPEGLGEYDKTQEQEAKFVAAAVLLPMKAVGMAIWRSEDPTEVAHNYGASLQLFEMRVKTLGLWEEYQSRINVEVEVQ